VKRPARQPVAGPGHLGDGGVREVDEGRVEGDRLDLPHALPRHRAALLLGDPRGVRLGGREHVGQHVRVEGALVERDLAGAVERGHDPGRDAHDPGRRAHVVAGGGVVAERERAARRRQERVTAQVHRAGPRVRVRAGEAHDVALHAERAQHRAEREVELLEHRPLLDVELQVGDRVAQARAGLAHPVELHAVGGERVGERRPVPVGEPAHRIRVERTRAGARAEQAAAEARALLVGPVDEHEGERALLGCERAQHLQPGDDVERPVQPAAVRDGVEVAAEHDEPLGLAGSGRPRVAGLVGLDRHALDPVELGAQPLARRDPRVGPGDALGAVLVLRQLSDPAQARDRAGRVDRCHQRTAGPGAGCANVRWTKRPEPGSATTSPSQ
jgi:hypothetical protein